MTNEQFNEIKGLLLRIEAALKGTLQEECSAPVQEPEETANTATGGTDGKRYHKVKGSKRWTDDEIRLIRLTAGKDFSRAEYAQMFPNRTLKAISNKLADLGIRPSLNNPLLFR